MTLRPNQMIAVVAALFAGAGGGVFASGIAAQARPPATLDATHVAAALAQRLPKTRITHVDCKKLSGLCEITAGTNLFYVDATSRFLVIGRVYDMQTRQDLTAARLLELSPDALVTGAAKADGAEDEPDAGNGAQPAAPMIAAKPVDLKELPADGAIRWGPVNGPKLVVFTDFHCGYCRAMTGELQQNGFRVEERPISILGSRKLSEAVYCAHDPQAALHAAYEGREPGPGRHCDTKGLDANEAFARRHGFNGTPVIVRPSDGAVIQGYRPLSTLNAFARGGAAS
jgi:thiol:disulfide interchange protein DsbC